MICHGKCPVCSSVDLCEIAGLTHVVTSPDTIQSAGINVILRYVLCLDSVTISTLVCKNCRHIFHSPFFSIQEINRLYSPEFRELTKAAYRQSEAISGRSWAEQNAIRPDRQLRLREEADAFRPRRLKEVLTQSNILSDINLSRICDVGGMSGQLLSRIQADEKYVYDKDTTLVSEKNVVPLISNENFVDHGPYDLLVLSHVLEHVPKPTEWIACLADSLSSNGVFYIEVPLQYCGAIIKRHAIPIGVHVNYFCVKSLLACLDAAGISAVHYISREIVPYGELRMPVIKAVAGRTGNIARKRRGRNWLIDLVWDSSLILRARKGWFRL